jgi:hypothetical protein
MNKRGNKIALIRETLINPIGKFSYLKMYRYHPLMPETKSHKAIRVIDKGSSILKKVGSQSVASDAIRKPDAVIISPAVATYVAVLRRTVRLSGSENRSLKYGKAESIPATRNNAVVLKKAAIKPRTPYWSGDNNRVIRGLTRTPTSCSANPPMV